MRQRFEDQLKKLNEELVQMGAEIEKAINSAVHALINQDIEEAKSIVEADDIIDHKEKEIEAICFKLLLQQQPVASDLRLVSSALKMITDMERIGDLAADICELVILLGDRPHVKELDHIKEMAKVATQMVKESIDAYVNNDLELAQSIVKLDDVVDDLFLTVKGEIAEIIHRDLARGEQAIDLLMISKYFERIGDHAVNISEWVVFSITGKHKNERVL